jgi:hypothetical protein
MKARILFLTTVICISSVCTPLMGMNWLWGKIRGKKASNNTNTSLVSDEPAGKIVYKKTLSQKDHAEYTDGCAFFALFRALNLKNDNRANSKKDFDAWLKIFQSNMILDHFKVSREEWIKLYGKKMFNKAFSGGKANVPLDWCCKKAEQKYEADKDLLLQNLHSDNFRMAVQESITLPGQVIVCDSLTELMRAIRKQLCTNEIFQKDIVHSLRLFQQGETVAIILNTGEVADKEGGGTQLRGAHWITLILKKVNGQAQLCIHDSVNPDRHRALQHDDPRADVFKSIYDFWTTKDPEEYNCFSNFFGQFQTVFAELNKNGIFSSIQFLACENNRSLVKNNLTEHQGAMIEQFLIDVLLPAVIEKIQGSKLTYKLRSGIEKKKIKITFEKSFLQGKPALISLEKNGLKLGMIEGRLKSLRSNKATKQFSDRIDYVLQTLELLSHIKELQGYFKNPTQACFFLSIVETFPLWAQCLNKEISCASRKLVQEFAGQHNNLEEYKRFLKLIGTFNAEVCSEDSRLSEQMIETLGLKVLQSLQASATDS